MPVLVGAFGDEMVDPMIIGPRISAVAELARPGAKAAAEVFIFIAEMLVGFGLRDRQCPRQGIPGALLGYITRLDDDALELIAEVIGEGSAQSLPSSRFLAAARSASFTSRV